MTEGRTGDIEETKMEDHWWHRTLEETEMEGRLVTVETYMEWWTGDIEETDMVGQTGDIDQTDME